jgi:hypothetical protein
LATTRLEAGFASARAADRAIANAVLRGMRYRSACASGALRGLAHAAFMNECLKCFEGLNFTAILSGELRK